MMKLNTHLFFQCIVSVVFSGALQAQEVHPACSSLESDKALLVAQVLNSQDYSPGVQAVVSEFYSAIGHTIPIYPMNIQTKEPNQYSLFVTVSSKESFSDNDEGFQLLLPFIAIGSGENQYFSTIQVDFMLLESSSGRVLSAFSTYSVLRDSSVAKNAEADHQRIGIFWENGKGRTDNTLFSLRGMYRAAAIRALEIIKGLDAGSCRSRKSTSTFQQPTQIQASFDNSIERIEVTGQREDLRDIYFPKELASKIRCTSKGKCRIIFAAKPTRLMADLVEDAYANAYEDSVQVNCDSNNNSLECQIVGRTENLYTFNKKRFLKLLYGRSS